MSAPDHATLPRVLAGAGEGRPLSLAEHTVVHGRLPERGPDLIEAVQRAGLRGRGGAAFPTAVKMQAVAGGRRSPVVVANGAEGEPASAKDRLLLEELPHLVLDGAVLAAEAVGAAEAIVCVKDDGGPALARVAAAVEERAGAGGDPVRLRPVAVPDHYLAGEESALVSVLNGGPAKPTFVPPRPFERGVSRRPTLIQNVETLAHVALIARHGARWFRQLGTAAEPGSTLVTLLGGVQHPGVYELARGTALADLLDAAGGAPDGVGAVLLGGYFGSWADASLAGTLRLEDAELSGHGATLGSGVVAVLPGSACGPAETARVAPYLARSSAQQCGPCLNGLPALAGALQSVVGGRSGARVWDDVHRWLARVNGRGACHHPNGAVRLIASALRVFEADWEEHAAHGPCAGCAAPAVLPVPQDRAPASTVAA